MQSGVDKLIGSQFASRYIVRSLLGKQKGRRTFLAEDAQTHSLVVLKLILFGPDFTWEDLKLFEREAETLKSLEHPAIPAYLDSFEIETAIGKGFVLVQTYIEAKSLQAWVTTGRRFSEQALKEIAQSMLMILQHLHSRHPAVIHRDIKPSNILLADRSAHSVGTIYLIDFGSVQVAQHGGTITIVGTYGYMPPEQFGGRSLPASDLYSLGATLVYLASGLHPADFAEPGLEEAISSINLDLSPQFTQWIRQLVKAKVSERVPSAAIAFHNLTHAQPTSQQISFNTATEKPSLDTLSGHTSPATTAIQPKKKDFLSIANGSFKLRSTDQTLVVRFYQHRIQEKLAIQASTQLQKKPSPSTRKFVGIPSASTAVLLMTIAVVSQQTAVFFLLLLLSIPLWLALLSHSDGSDYPGSASLSLSRSSDGVIFLSADVLYVATDKKAPAGAIASNHTTQFVNIPLRSVYMANHSFGCYAVFAFQRNQQLWHPNLRISGSRQEIKELLEHIDQWDSSIVEQGLPERE